MAITNNVAFIISPFLLFPMAISVIQTEAINERMSPVKGNLNICKIPPRKDSLKAQKAVIRSVTLVLKKL
ncbi:MAG: hypothetical protein KA319_07895 [Ferruginibacter sp.]|nr:hypothetical protein [Ferruginibacter sp.]